MSYHLFGIRHHGPGCARSLVAALDELRPDVIVMEGPADAESVLAAVVHPAMKPPVAMLMYAADDAKQSVFYPLAVFSPEWQALQWANRHQVSVRLMDLPQCHQLAMHREEMEKAKAAAEQGTVDDQDSQSAANPDNLGASESSSDADASRDEAELAFRLDPLSKFAEAAGFKDHELWWEEQIERREQAGDLFTAIREAMTTVRAEAQELDARDRLRESYMRKVLRETTAQKYERIAVICGAWHVPALTEEAIAGKCEGMRAKDDNERLKGLPKIKVQATWIPWTYSRMTRNSGYGAGVHSPGWYAHLWHSNRQAGVRWLASAAQHLRRRDLDASSAGVIEAVRLADALAALRGLRAPGLEELNESILTVLCHGEAAPLELIRKQLEIGGDLGEVPEDTPAVPLAQDLAEQQKRLRFKPSAEQKLIDLDLRKENDLERSRLLHRLACLDIDWGKREGEKNKSSTFHEVWRVEWQPEFSVSVITAGVWGNSVEAAAAAKLVNEAESATELSEITERLDRAVLAGLKAAIDPLLVRIQTQSAVAADVRHLLDAMLPLARTSRYGDVRGTTSEHIEPILFSMFERAMVGLSAACSMLDDEAAERMVLSMSRAQESLNILQRDEWIVEWLKELRRLAQGSGHGLLRGWCYRMLLEQQALAEDELFRAARLALSPANSPHECAAWAGGLLRGSGLVLLQEEGVWQVFDRWLSELNEETFVEMVPLLRRAFADFTPPERRQMGEKVKRLKRSEGEANPHAYANVAATSSRHLNEARAARCLPVLAEILGAQSS